ncbi:hypothetical protein M406DRAFT_104930 [Cryphonectria parasitica EP155]|uniref:Rhodopsin domain-containing protein n=1 Tax=Cryphonectria parasitica (strain ATCC 38755 / EP155) TaxID=660469 RepID=A0A9P4Y9H1_CRYP1|nr:uncharacterized protein M406DRAFT_104930 [Cryphonectria parasitica EP155]KAF3769434.1 hypothetical protein M406DRAFT_104930 [Cryphonectria parasitica EP155]
MADLDEDERHEIAVSYGSIIGTGLLAIIICCTRLLTRKFIIKAFSVDDWACLIALVLTTTFNSLGIAVVYNGAGRHIEHVSAQELTTWFKLYYACTCFYLIIACAVKSSLLALMWRLFPLLITHHCAYTTALLRRAGLCLFIFMTLFTISGTFVAAFQCNPPKYVYDLTYVMAADRAAHCYSPNTAYGVFLYQAVILFAIDIIIFMYPVPALWGLRMTRGKGLVSVLVFGSAVVACIAPALRFQSLSFYKSGSSDMTWFNAAEATTFACKGTAF